MQNIELIILLFSHKADISATNLSTADKHWRINSAESKGKIKNYIKKISLRTKSYELRATL